MSLKVDPRIGARLAELRQHFNLSRDALGKLINVSEGLIWQYETGRVRIPAQRLTDMAAALHIDASEFHKPRGARLPRVRFRPKGRQISTPLAQREAELKRAYHFAAHD